MAILIITTTVILIAALIVALTAVAITTLIVLLSWYSSGSLQDIQDKSSFWQSVFVYLLVPFFGQGAPNCQSFGNAHPRVEGDNTP